MYVAFHQTQKRQWKNLNSVVLDLKAVSNTLNKKWQIVFKLFYPSSILLASSCFHVSDQKHCSVCKHVGIQLHVDSQILPTIHLQLLYLQRVWSPRSALSAVGVSGQQGRSQIRSSHDEPEPLDDSDVPACSLVTQPLFS